MEEDHLNESACAKGTAQPGIAAGVLTPASSEIGCDCDEAGKPQEQIDTSDAPSPFPPFSTHEPLSNPPLDELTTPPPSPSPSHPPSPSQSLLTLTSELKHLRTTISTLESRLSARKQELSAARELLRLKDFIIVESARQTSEVEGLLEEKERKLEGWRERVRRREGEIEMLRGERRRSGEERGGEVRGVEGIEKRRSGVEGDMRGVERRRESRRESRREGGWREDGWRENRKDDGWRESRREDGWRDRREDRWREGIVRERGGQTWVDVRVRVGGG